MADHRGKERAEGDEEKPVASEAMGGRAKHGAGGRWWGRLRCPTRIPYRLGMAAGKHQNGVGSAFRARHVAQALAHAMRHSATL